MMLLRYDKSEIEPFLIDVAPSPPSWRRRPTDSDAKKAQIEPIVAACAWMQHVRNDAAELSEPEWYASLSVIGRCQDGENIAHEWSSVYPGYSEKETDAKLKHALEVAGPVTCRRVEEITGGEWCKVCELRGMITSPIVVGNPEEVAKRESRDIVSLALERAEEEPTAIFDAEVIGALAVLKKEEPSEYAKTKHALRGKVNLNDLERAVNLQIAENQKLRLVTEREPPATLENVLPDLPMKELRKPYEWSLNENGVWQSTKNGPVCACSVPVILTKRLRNIDTAQEKVELAFYRDAKWHYILADRANVFSRTSLVQLGNKGLPVSSESAKHLVRYLEDLERVNLHTLPLVRSVSHMGWVGRNFLPGAEGDIVLDTDDEGALSVVSGYSQSGTIKEWVAAVHPVRKEHPIARFMMSASFAAPLLKVVGQRVFIIHAWGASRGGKTAAAKAALSVWGDPDILLANFNATRVGLERLAAFYSDLPLVVDEKQVVGDRQGFIESIVYMIGLGKGKTRGAKGGGIQASTMWRTIAMTTGEEPLSTHSSRGGVSTRAIELYGLPIGDEALAGKIHEVTKEHHGHAGILFVRRMMQALADDPDIFKADYEALREELEKRSGDKSRSHLSAVATVILGDYYSSRWIFGLGEEEAFRDGMVLAEIILGQLEAAADMEDAARAMEWVRSWIEQHMPKFQEAATERYGWIDSVGVCIFPTVFQKCLEEGGFSERRILRDFADRDWIETAIEGGKIVYKVKRQRENVRSRVVVIKHAQ